jgi:predicted DNA-binding transcriptional regulator YafY
MKKKMAVKRGRKPTYPAAMRLARIAVELGSRPYGWSFESIRKELGISERTLLRYVAACRAELLDWTGKPIIEVVPRRSGRWLRLSSLSRSADSNPYRAASLYFMLTLLKFLEGTVIKESVEDLWERSFKNSAAHQQRELTDFDRKFYTVPYAPKIYRDYDDQLDLILRSLIGQNTIRVDYAGLTGEGKEHEFDPYTLIAHRGGLYVIGQSHLYKKMIYFAVERIRKVEFLLDRDKNRVRFAYPKSYRPEKHLDGTFGLLDGPLTEVELLLLADTEAYLRPRMIHPTQKFHQRRDGKTILTMQVRGTTELRNFILGLGPWVKVLKPPALREEMAELARETAALYIRYR